ncbi:MAG: hypothetical protein H7X93_12275, partial [Sphingomonadaceae bacterium]|nr:hypothetical protein [Sphingomonadaceae bacterium]
MASTIGYWRRQSERAAALAPLAWLERRLEAERDQLPLWIPVGLGAGIAAWFALPTREGWIALLLIAL